MRRRRRRARVSAGTLFMLGLTLCVVLCCAGFLYMITGADAAQRASAILANLSFADAASLPTAALRSTQLETDGMGEAPAASVTPSAAPTATPVPGKRTITIAATGTVYAPKAVRESVQSGADQFDFAPVFAAMTDTLSDADLTIATLETTTAGREKGYGNYNTPAAILDALRACGVDLLALATERALDKGMDGLVLTLREIASRGLSHAGVSADAQPGRMMSVGSVGGVQVAVLAYSYGLSEEGAAQDADAQGMVALMDMARVRSDIARARQAGVNLVIVLPHWGTKNKQAVPEAVTAMARELAQAGADIILGTHPNVVQGIERIHAQRADGLMYETLVCYSLGSLLTDARTAENTAGMAVSIEVTYDPVTRRTQVGACEVTPLYIAHTDAGDARGYRVVPAEDEAALSLLEESEREAARAAAQLVRAVTQEERP